MTPDELPGWWQEHIDRVPRATMDAANAMALQFTRGVQTVELRRYTHPPGTRTTSPPGQPPALVTGTLRRSVRPDWSHRPGLVVKSSVAPHTVYARIQELGGHIRPVRAKALRWVEDGRVVFSMHSRLPARPYMRPARIRMTMNGQLKSAARNAFFKAMGWERG